MNNSTDRLKAALLTRERTQALLANIEGKKNTGTLSASQYDLLKSDYQQKMAAAVAEISNIKSDLRAQLQTFQDRMNTIHIQLEELRARHDADEYSLSNYQKLERRLLQQSSEIKKEIPLLQALIEAKASIQLGNISTGTRSTFPRWAFITSCIVGAILVLAAGGYAAYAYFLEPNGYKLPWISGITDNATSKQQATENVTSKTPSENITVKPVITDDATKPSDIKTDNTTTSSEQWKSLISIAEKSVVTFQADNTTVAGILVGNNGYILTCKRYLKTRGNIQVVTSTGIQYPARIVTSEYALGILKLESDNYTIPFVKMGESSQIKVGDEVAVAGYNAGTAVDSKRVYKIKSRESVSFHIDIENNSVYMGAAVLNNKGELIAIIEGNVESGNNTSLIYALPVNPVKELIDNK